MTTRTLPESGTFTVASWAEHLDLTPETLEQYRRDYGMPSTEFIDAADWWRAIARTPLTTSTVTIQMVDGHIFTRPGEAQAAAATSASLSGQPVQILEATIAADFQPIRTVQPQNDRDRAAMRASRRARGGLRGQVVDIGDCRTNLLAIDIAKSVEATAIEIEEATEGMIEGLGIDGYRDVVAATDDECCLWKASVGVAGEFDVREPLPPQIAAWLREQASELMDLAEKLAGLDDDRDLDSLRRYVSGDPAIAFDYDAGVFNEVEPAA